jgi:hypothetical protein
MGECPEGITPSSGDGFDAQEESHNVGFGPEEDRGGAAGAIGEVEGREEGGVRLWGLLCAQLTRLHWGLSFWVVRKRGSSAYDRGTSYPAQFQKYNGRSRRDSIAD